MKYKTLKDFKVNPQSFAGAMANAGRKYTIDINELREEAIKWLATIRSDIWDVIYHSNPLFIQFFNITEKELNDVKHAKVEGGGK